MERAAHHIAFAEGRRGACRDYLTNTAEHAHSLGIHDPYLQEMVALVARLREQPVPLSAPVTAPLHALAK
jgi:cation transport protein ChaC